MASNLLYGSRGSEVKDLQRRLNQQGYSLAEDGIFGNKTQAAVKDYQRKNNLAVDGIVGKKSRKMLFGSTAQTDDGTGAGHGTPTPAPLTPKEEDKGGFHYDPYADSDNLVGERGKLDELMAGKPADDTGSYYQQVEEWYNAIKDRDPFSYDFNGDALYQQYKDKYIQQGKMAMQDTIGQASAMTGGYGNSYAATAGNQAYQASLQNLNDVIPELYQMAYDRYNQEGQDMMNQFGLAKSLYDTKYGEYMDELGQWNTDVSRQQGIVDNMSAEEYNRWLAGYEMAYGQHRDSVADDQWRTSFDESVRQYDESAALAKEQWDWQKEQAEKQASSGGSGGSGGGNGGGNGGGSKTGEATFADTLWYPTGTYDDNGNPVFRNSEGKTMAFGAGVNPYTGTKNKDAKNGTFSNGYQPNNINGQKLTNSGMSTNITGKSQTIWESGGKYWLWRGDLNKYVEVDISDID